MEDMLMPMHMMGGAGFGDVLIPISNPTQVFSIKETSPVPPAQGYVPDATIEFIMGGTGFIIHTFSGLVIENCYVLGIALTAFHVVCSLKTFEPKDFPLHARSETGKLLDLWLIKHYAQTFSDECISPTSRIRYCLPGDIAVLLITSPQPVALGKYNIADSLQINDDCFISGYPRQPDDITYCLPQYSQLPDLKNVVKKAFNNFNGLVYSSGKVLNMNENIIEIDCSTTNGMSGSPIIRNHELIGVYLGGPPVIGQRRLFELYRKVSVGMVSKAFKKLKLLKAYNEYFRFRHFTNLKQDFKNALAFEALLKKNDPEKYYAKVYKNYASKKLTTENLERLFEDSKNQLCARIMNEIYFLVSSYKNPGEYTFNIGLSVAHALFGDVRCTLSKLQSNPDVSSINNFINCLR
jgi:Trypsin-like peptidase domain